MIFDDTGTILSLKGLLIIHETLRGGFPTVLTNIAKELRMFAKGVIQIIRDTLRGWGSPQCHQMTQWGERGSSKASREFFFAFLSYIFVFLPLPQPLI